MAVALSGVAVALAACSSDDSSASETPDASGGTGGSAGSSGTGGTAGSAGTGADASTPGAPKVLLPKTALEPSELGVLVNDADPLSVQIADYYVTARQIPSANVVHLTLPAGAVLSQTDFATAKSAVDAALGPNIQALALTWTEPYRVECMSVTSAFALGFDLKHCNTTAQACGPTALVGYFDSDSVAPLTDHQIRPAMSIAATTLDDAKALIDRGIAADDTFPTGNGWFVRTTDTARSVRWNAFLQTLETWKHPEGLTLTYVDNSDGSGQNQIENETDVLFYFTGLASVPGIDTLTYRPGAIADHLTSFGGQVPTSGQMSAIEWLRAGATASFGTTVEPCNFTSKFPDTRVLLRRYFRGATLLEAYWKSVSTPGEGLFIGEPLARPWGATTVEYASEKLTITTTLMDPNKVYALEGADAESGQWSTALAPITIPNHQRFAIVLEPATQPFYRLVEAAN